MNAGSEDLPVLYSATVLWAPQGSRGPGGAHDLLPNEAPRHCEPSEGAQDSIIDKAGKERSKYENTTQS